MNQPCGNSVKRIKNDKGLFERIEINKVVLTEDNKMLLKGLKQWQRKKLNEGTSNKEAAKRFRMLCEYTFVTEEGEGEGRTYAR